MIQIIAVAASWAFSFVGTMIILKVVDSIVGLRVTKEEEEVGLDLSQHNERGYN
jgi:Amt family ammonium transporter